MTRIEFRKNGQPVPISGTITCETCGLEVPADQVLSVEHGATASRIAITHPPGHKVSFNIDGSDAVSLFMVDAR